jgi:hypothetical protein
MPELCRLAEALRGRKSVKSDLAVQALSDAYVEFALLAGGLQS